MAQFEQAGDTAQELPSGGLWPCVTQGLTPANPLPPFGPQTPNPNRCLKEERGLSWILLGLYNRIIESQNHLGWKRPLRSPSPTVNMTQCKSCAPQSLLEPKGHELYYGSRSSRDRANSSGEAIAPCPRTPSGLGSISGDIPTHLSG